MNKQDEINKMIDSDIDEVIEHHNHLIDCFKNEANREMKKMLSDEICECRGKIDAYKKCKLYIDSAYTRKVRL